MPAPKQRHETPLVHSFGASRAGVLRVAYPRSRIVVCFDMGWKRIAAVILIGTVVLTVLDVMQLAAYYLRVDEPAPPMGAVAWAFGEWAMRLLFCLPAIWLAQRYSYLASAFASIILAVLGVAASMIFILPQAIAVGEDITSLELNVKLFYFILQKYLLPGVALYWLVFAAVRAWSYHERMTIQTRQAAELERRNIMLRHRLEEARHAMLKSRIHPHFIFNTLNAIAVLARARRSRAVVQTSARLSKLLRATADTGQAVCTVREELKLVKDYLYIERVRFGRRLSVKWRVDRNALDVLVPRFCIQPMVDNAVKHGVGRTTSPVQIEIGVRVRGDRTHVWVHDDGAGVSGPVRWGFGLTSIQAMLDQAFGDTYTFSFLPADGGLRVEFSIPINPHSGWGTIRK